ncbi:MAG: RNA polymerase sigma factor [Candidatus Heteroscillospira sp.]
MDELELIARLRDRDESALEELLRHYRPLMRYIIAPLLRDAREREECLSDISLRVWEKIELYDPEKGGFKSWLTALTRNTALNRARKGTPDEEELLEKYPGGEHPEERLLRQEKYEALKNALTSLPREERALFYRKYYYMQPTAQIASELGLTERAVEGRLYRLKKKLRRALGGDDLG